MLAKCYAAGAQRAQRDPAKAARETGCLPAAAFCQTQAHTQLADLAVRARIADNCFCRLSALWLPLCVCVPMSASVSMRVTTNQASSPTQRALRETSCSSSVWATWRLRLRPRIPPINASFCCTHELNRGHRVQGNKHASTASERTSERARGAMQVSGSNTNTTSARNLEIRARVKIERASTSPVCARMIMT